MPDPRTAARVIAQAAPWRPASAGALLRPLRPRVVGSREAHLRAAADWLRRAQEATPDGGVSWGYRLREGWAPSYPETTGYIVPTLLALDGGPYRDGEDRRRVEEAIAFLANVRLPDGAFPGGRVDENRARPSVFNTAQILHGLTAWHRASGDAATAEMAAMAARWLADAQDDDGAWRRHTYNGLPVAYVVHGSCWLAEHAEHAGDAVARAAAERHLDWVLARFDPEAAWFDLAGFTAEDHAARRSVTHTLAYTVWGVLDLGIRLGREDAVSAAAAAATRVAGVVRRDGFLPGMLDAGWRAGSTWQCLTGNSQMALVWQRLEAIGHPGGDREAARTVLDAVLAAQSLTAGDDGIRGAIAGSDPPWGAYLRFVFPNWAAKFTIDALLGESSADGDPGAG